MILKPTFLSLGMSSTVCRTVLPGGTGLASRRDVPCRHPVHDQHRGHKYRLQEEAAFLGKSAPGGVWQASPLHRIHSEQSPHTVHSSFSHAVGAPVLTQSRSASVL